MKAAKFSIIFTTLFMITYQNKIEVSTMIKAVFITLLFSLYSFGAAAMAQADRPIANPDGEFVMTGPDDIWPKTMTGSHFNEFWNYQFYFDNGMKAHIVFSVANFGNLKSPVSGVRISIFGLSDEIYHLSREYPIGELSLERDTYKFNLNPRQDNVWFKGKLPESMEIYINTAKDGERFNIELKLENIAQGYQWADGKFRIHDDQVGILTHIPYAKVTGRVGINENIKDVRGTAYMDHTYQTQTTTRLMHSGYRFVSHKDSENWDVVYFMQPKNQMGRQTIGYKLSKENGTLVHAGVVGIINEVPGKAFRENVPKSMTMYLSNEKTIRIDRVADQERYSVLGQLSWAARRIARTFLGGDVIDLRGTATLKQDGKPTKNGDYNFFLVD
jgi:hypothetical protein